MQVLLLSIKPRYAQEIIQGNKTVELRRIAPKIDSTTVVLLYESSPVKAITGFALMRTITRSSPEEIWSAFSCETQVTKNEFDRYYTGAHQACAMHIASATGFDEPISLADLRNENILTNPPQSYRYLSLSVFEGRDELQTRLLEAGSL